MLSKYKLNQLYFKDTQFANLIYILVTSLSASFLTGFYGRGSIDAVGEYVIRSGDLYAEYGRQ